MITQLDSRLASACLAPCKRAKKKTASKPYVFSVLKRNPSRLQILNTNYRFLKFFLLIPPALTVGTFTLLSPFFNVDASLSGASEEVASSLSTFGFTSLFVVVVVPPFCAEYSSFLAWGSLGLTNRFTRDRMSAINQVLFIAGRVAVDSSMRCISPDGSSCLFIFEWISMLRFWVYFATYKKDLWIINDHIQPLGTGIFSVSITSIAQANFDLIKNQKRKFNG